MARYQVVDNKRLRKNVTLIRLAEDDGMLSRKFKVINRSAERGDVCHELKDMKQSQEVKLVLLLRACRSLVFLKWIDSLDLNSI